jgi:glycosyltransferase involved in cell wall biosynthesis
MRILILIDAWFPFTGGAQIQIKNLKKILERKYKVKYFIFHSSSSNILLRFFWSFWVIPQVLFFQLGQYLKSGRYWNFDLIHSHAYWPGIPGKILSRILGIPIVFTVHGSNLLDLKKRTPRAWLEKFILTKISYNQVISVSSSFLKYKNVNKNIKVIPNGVDLKLFEEVKVEKAKPFKILFVGRNDPVKGLIYLKKAILEVKKEFPQARLKIITAGLNYQDLAREYKSSHVFVLPSLSEGQPLTLLEAWAAKLPVVVTRVGENIKMVRNGYNGYLVKPQDVNDLSKGIIKVLKNKKRKLLGERGFNLVKEKYSWEKCAQKTYEVYKKTLSEE